MVVQRPDNPDPAILWGALSAPQRALVSHLTASAEAEGGEIFLVGGPVRDLLRGETRLHDIDVVTTTDARQVARRFATTASAAVTKTTDFGTATVRARDGDTSVDLATARTEIYPRPGALPTVAFPAGIDADLHRRDVTINAMALPITPRGFGNLLDPTGGLADLRAGRIRVLHDGTFRDDPTRLYRVARYAARFGFTVEPYTLTLLRAAIADGALATISADRKRNELALGLREADPVACFTAFNTYGLLRATSPALIWDEWVAARLPRVAPELWAVCALFVCRQDNAAIARLLKDIPVGAKRVGIRRLVRVWKERETIAVAARLSTIRPILEEIGEHEVLALLHDDPAHKIAVAFYERLRHIQWQEMHEGRSFGNFLKELGVPPGPVYRDILRALRDARMDGDVETRDEAETFVRKVLAEHSSAR